VHGPLDVDVDAATNLDLLAGRLRGVTVRAGRIVFDGAPVSGGCALYVQSLTLPQTAPFAVSVNATVTQGDLNAAGTPLFAMLERLLDGVVSTSLSGLVGRALQARDGRANVLDAVALEGERGGRLVMRAHSRLVNGATLRYAVRAGLAIAADGRTVELARPELTWRGLPVPLAPLARVGVGFQREAKVTALDLTADGLFVEGIIVVTPPGGGQLRPAAPASDPAVDPGAPGKLSWRFG
jgi:hypothetical protein